jgi:hypothetical protein
MRRFFPVLRCRCIRCAAARRRWLFVIIALGVAIVASWRLLVPDHRTVPGGDENLPDALAETSRGSFDTSSAEEQSAEAARIKASNSAADADATSAKSNLKNPRLSRELVNAALAAGLIDPSRIEFVEPINPAPSPALDHAISLSEPTAKIPSTDPAKDSGSQPMSVAGAPPMTPPAASPTSSNESLFETGPPTDKIVSVSRTQIAEAEPEVSAPPHRRDIHGKSSSLAIRKFATRLIARSGSSSAGTASAVQGVGRADSPANGAKRESSPEKRTDDSASQSRDLSDKLQRFASDFVRANQTDNVAEQHRFYADSVHFYGEGDLSLAGVEAATRRYHRDQQSKRSEVAEPAAATGPVNGGFYVIEQPVRWTQSQGSQVKRGRSVLRLRVVPIERGGWKITSIDEVSK